jgi:3-oxoadipate enol-lactonase
MPPIGDAVTPTTHGFVHASGAAIYYEVTGSGPPIVFAHGLGGNHLSWWQQMPYFARDYRCVTFAHRGFAPSDGVPDPELYAADLAALIDHLQLPPVRLVAQSMGGWACLEYTLGHAERVAQLVMAATAGAIDLTTLGSPAGAEAEEWQRRNLGAGEALFRRGIHPAAGERMAREQPALHFLYRGIDRINHALDKQALRARLGAMRTVPVSRLKDMRTPVLFLAGEEDVVFPPPAAAGLAAAAPAGKVRLVAKAGHSVYFERPGVFNELVGAFFQSAHAQHV